MTTLEPRTNLRPNVSFTLPQFGSAPAHESRTATATVMDAVRSAVRGVAENTLRPVARRDSGLAYQPRALLATLARDPSSPRERAAAHWQDIPGARAGSRGESGATFARLEIPRGIAPGTSCL